MALTVVMAAKGYPGSYAKGGVISGVEDVSTAKVRGSPRLLTHSFHPVPVWIDMLGCDPGFTCDAGLTLGRSSQAAPKVRASQRRPACSHTCAPSHIGFLVL